MGNPTTDQKTDSILKEKKEEEIRVGVIYLFIFLKKSGLKLTLHVMH